MNIRDLGELREIREDEETLTLGAACTFGEIRECAAVKSHFPLLAQAARLTGGIAKPASVG